ncbi:MAG TPA: gamma-glutamyl-phosphate reductase, partial [Bradyrhizobium sp.]|nr:gamma-glutamyl-phosphate reductase [Bradyrhizobium sp.]
MSAPLKAVDASADLPVLMAELAARTRAAARVLALAPADQKNEALQAMQAAIVANASTILADNAEDVAEARAAGASSAFIDR